MTGELHGHTPARAAEIIRAATEAGAHNAQAVLKCIPAGEMVNAADAVAKLKADEPVLFKKSALDMTASEFADARRNIVTAAERARQAKAAAAQHDALMAGLTKKYSK